MNENKVRVSYSCERLFCLYDVLILPLALQCKDVK